jgi:uncharacterized membrane protein
MEFLSESVKYGIILSFIELVILSISAFFYMPKTNELEERAYSFLKFIIAFILFNIIFMGILNYR